MNLQQLVEQIDRLQPKYAKRLVLEALAGVRRQVIDMSPKDTVAFVKDGHLASLVDAEAEDAFGTEGLRL